MVSNWTTLVLTHIHEVPLIIQDTHYQRCVPHSTCFSCCRCSMSARGSIEGLPWAHWKGSLQDDKASISLQLSSRVKCSLNLIAPEKVRHILAPAAKEDSTSLYSCGFQGKQGISQRSAERLQRQSRGCSVADLGLSSVKAELVCCIRRSAYFPWLKFSCSPRLMDGKIIMFWHFKRQMGFFAFLCVCVTAKVRNSSQIKKY